MVGLAGFLIVALASAAIAEAGGRSGKAGELTIRGSDISRRGGVDLLLKSHGLVVRQHCRGACDELSPATGFQSVRVLDAKGGCVICERRGVFGPSRLGPNDMKGAGKSFNVDVRSIGADVSRHGGVKLVVSSERGDHLVQTCSGPCDDMEVEIASGDDSYRVKVLDAAGNCVACDAGVYVTSGVKTHWIVSGADALTAKVSSRD